MPNHFDIFFSNRLEVLYTHLKETLFPPLLEPPLSSTSPLNSYHLTSPFIRRLVVVYGPAMKSWLMLKLAQDPDLNIATGIEFIYLHQAFEKLLELTSQNSDQNPNEYQQKKYIPTLLELTLAIEKELVNILHNYSKLTAEEQEDWLPLLHHLKLEATQLNLNSSFSPSRKIEKRLTSLSQHLARHFQNYGRFAPKMIAKWEELHFRGWQPSLWRTLFKGRMKWTYPLEALNRKEGSKLPQSSRCTIHLFSISFLTASEFAFLYRISSHFPIHYYLLSPCAVFWSDIRSDKETARLQSYWQQKLGSFSPQVMQLEEFLRDRNPLLANFGRMGREMASQIEESQIRTHAHYLLPEHTSSLGEEHFIHDDLYFTKSSSPLSLLHALQGDLVIMRNPQESPPIDLQEGKSIQLHIASNRREEIQILYHQLLKLMEEDPSLCPSDIIVMAPEVTDYIPYIERTFGTDESQLDFQVLDLGMHTQSEIVQGFLHLLNLSESRWNGNNLLQLFEHPSFQRRHQLSSVDGTTIHKWIEQTGIWWGDTPNHRNELLKRRHCQQEMAEESEVGTWDYGLSRLLYGLTTVAHEEEEIATEAPPCSTIDFSQGELLGKWTQLCHALRDDLSLLENQIEMTMEQWVNYLTSLLDSYFQPDFTAHRSVEEFDELKKQFTILSHSARFFKETKHSFSSVKTHLLSLLQNRGVTYREDHLQAIRFCSLIPLRSIPAKVIALLGMEEEAFPRMEHHSSLNLMIGEKEVDYSPSATDYDRYLFLEALHSAQETLLISYQGYHQQESKELRPSLIIEELFSYLEKYYTVNGKKIREVCIFNHPFNVFDQRYFSKEGELSNFSHHDFKKANAYYTKKKIAPHSFLSEFTIRPSKREKKNEPQKQIDIRTLSAMTRNPIKFHLNHAFEIFIQTKEDRTIKTEEELVISPLNKYRMKQSTLKHPLEKVLSLAEKRGELPFGLFKKVASKRLKEEVSEIHAHLSNHQLTQEDLFQIECSSSCLNPTKLDDHRWLYPPLILQNHEGESLSIVGKLPFVSSKGLVILGKSSLAEACKGWPQFLLYCHAARLSQGKLKPQLIFTHSKESKKAFFHEPDPYFKQLIDYHSLCLDNFSPLLPEWISSILNEEVGPLKEKMKEIFIDPFGSYQNQELRWTLNKHSLPSTELLIQHWKPHAEKLFGALHQFWYS